VKHELTNSIPLSRSQLPSFHVTAVADTRFIPGMIDSLNAEVALGTIANVPEAIQWLGYTYLFGQPMLIIV